MTAPAVDSPPSQVPVLGNDLTTTRAPFIEEAKADGQLFIEQPYELYSENNHEAWRRLYQGMLPRWRQYANERFREGVERLAIDSEAVPRLEDINRFLAPLTGFEAKAVSGYVPSYLFFDCLRRSQFPTTITIRDLSNLDYLPEPDIFHDVAGHVPMHTDPHFARVLVRLGEVVHRAAKEMQSSQNDKGTMAELESIIKAIARFFWFTVEFGLMGDPKAPKVYGSGLLSSFGEIAHSVDSPRVQRFPFHLGWVINQYFEIDHYQPLLFVVESFEHLFDQIEELERWLLAGKLSNVAPGEPHVDPRDLESWLRAA